MATFDLIPVLLGIGYDKSVTRLAAIVNPHEFAVCLFADIPCDEHSPPLTHTSRTNH